MANNKKKSINSVGKISTIMAAAMSLPISSVTQAESAPESGEISFKYLNYLDSQDHVPDTFSGASSSTDHDRVKVKAHALRVMVPIAGKWSISGSYTTDSISGASPNYQSSQLVNFSDYRRAGDIQITRYLPRGTISMGISHSSENDYISRGFSLQGTLASEDKNTTVSLGFGLARDEIDSSDGDVVDEEKQVNDWLLGVTQVVTMNDIIQLNLGYSNGNGYFSDPYKFLDRRPDKRNHYTILTRWNHHFNSINGTSRLSYRYYDDTYDIKAHTLIAEYVQPFDNGWTVTPSIRFYSQTAAGFYVGEDINSSKFFDIPAVTNPSKNISLDQRLAEYGAVTLGIKISKQLTPNWLVDFKYEHYVQKEDWALTSHDQGDLDAFSFRSFQLGISRKF